VGDPLVRITNVGHRSVVSWAAGWVTAVAASFVSAVGDDLHWAPRCLIFVVLGGGGFSCGAFWAEYWTTQSVRAARRQAIAWFAAFLVAVGMLAIGSSGPQEALPDSASLLGAPQELEVARASRKGTLPEEYFRPLAALAVFGSLGGFLSVLARTSWTMQILAFARAVAVGSAWLAMLPTAGVATVVGGYLSYHAIADLLPAPSTVVAGLVGFALPGAVVGLGLGVGGETLARLSTTAPPSSSE
jgi:hypothetical protein